MKRIVTILLALLMTISGLTASAAMAFPNQQLSFRTGPNTRYTELFTLPQSTYIRPIEAEEGNGVTWILCEFDYKGKTYYGYTGLKRMEIVGDLYYADHAYINCLVRQATSVYSAPYSGAIVGKVRALEMVNLLKVEGSSVYIEFYDGTNKAPSRGWIPSSMINLSDATAAYALEASSVYTDPTTSSSKVGKIGKYEMIGYIETIGSYDHIAFYNASHKSVVTGFVPSYVVGNYNVY